MDMDQKSTPTVNLPQAIFDAIVSHAREGKPEEICGVLHGRDLTAKEAIRGRNIAAERIENYIVDPQTLLLQFKFEDAGDEMMGIYHSHPVSVAYPSASDAWNAHYPDSIYFICSLQYNDAPVIRAFRMSPQFIDTDITTLRAALDFYETRPRLFAYFQENGKTVPPVLAVLAGETPVPFYVVFHMAGDTSVDSSAADSKGESAECRIVAVTEYPIRIT